MKRQMPIVIGIALGRHDVTQDLANDVATRVVQADLDATVTPTNKEFARH
jgi:hypothetical protein